MLCLKTLHTKELESLCSHWKNGSLWMACLGKKHLHSTAPSLPWQACQDRLYCPVNRSNMDIIHWNITLLLTHHIYIIYVKLLHTYLLTSFAEISSLVSSQQTNILPLIFWIWQWPWQQFIFHTNFQQRDQSEIFHTYSSMDILFIINVVSKQGFY